MSDTFAALERYLRALPQDKLEDTLTFEQVEGILNDKLPPSAHLYYAWWAYQNEENHFAEQAWLNTGWRMDAVHFEDKWVRFCRV